MWRHWYCLVVVGAASCMAWSPIPSKVCKVFKRKDLRPDFPVQACGLNEQVRRDPDLRLFPDLRIASWR
jgi:hypothetical protein